MHTRKTLTLVLLAFTLGCGAHAGPNTTPQSQVAFYGTQVLSGALAVQSAIIEANTAGVLSTVQARTFLDGIDLRVRVTADRLSLALKAYDAASTAGDRTTTRAAVFTALTALESGLDAVFPDRQALIPKILAAVTHVYELLTTLRGALVLP